MTTRNSILFGVAVAAVLIAVGLLSLGPPSPQPPARRGDGVVDENGVALGWPAPYNAAMNDCINRVTPGLRATVAREYLRERAAAVCLATGYK